MEGQRRALFSSPERTRDISNSGVGGLAFFSERRKVSAAGVGSLPWTLLLHSHVDSKSQDG